jgi:cysteine desulfurase
MYGPKGIGALYVRRARPKLTLEPLQYGGGHERGYRSGTLAVPMIVALGRAARLAGAAVAAGEPERQAALRDRLWGRLAPLGAILNGHPTERLPHNLHVSVPGVEAPAVMMAAREIAFSSGSACASGGTGASHVMVAMGLGGARAFSSLRFGVGRGTTEADIDRAGDVLTDVITRLRAEQARLGSGIEGPWAR